MAACVRGITDGRRPSVQRAGSRLAGDRLTSDKRLEMGRCKNLNAKKTLGSNFL